MQSSECRCKHTVKELYFKHEFAHGNIIETLRPNHVTDGNASATQRRKGQGAMLAGVSHVEEHCTFPWLETSSNTF